SGVWQGESTIDLGEADPGRLAEPEYGIALGRQLINPAVERALVFAGAGNGVPVRVRLFLEGEAARLHTVVWERMYLRLDENQAAWPIATAPHVAFSRYIPVEIPDEVPMDEPAFRLLIAVANPSDLGDASLEIDVEKELGAFVTEFEKTSMPARLAVTVLPGRTGISETLAGRMKKLGWEVESPGAASLQNVAAVAARKKSHGIHILSHGAFKGGRGQGFLYLEKEDGTKHEVPDDSLRTWIGPKLRLVLLQACKSGARAAAGREDPFVGLAAKLVRYGVPAVVAMQDLVAVDDARVFVAAFYRELMQDGFVDHAVNEGRRAIESIQGEWWIPAVYQRLANGKLWCADPVRDEVWNMRRRIAVPPEVPEVLPIQVVQEANGLRFNPVDAPVGPVFDLHTHALKLLENEQHVCITGPSGSNKTEQLQLLYCKLADEFLKDSLQNAAPVWLGISELAGHRSKGKATESYGEDRFRQALQQAIGSETVALFLTDRKFVFLIDADEDLAPADMRGALRCLSGLMQRLPGSSCVMVMQESELSGLQVLFPDTKVFVAKPLDLPVLRGFLMTTGNESDSKLRALIDERGLGDLAAAPWLLSQMRDLIRFGHALQSRAAVMELVAENFLTGFGSRGIPRRCALESMCGIAWAMQYSRRRTLPDTEVWKILDTARGKREFRISELRDALIDGNLLFPAGEDAVGLSYKAIRSYFAARYLYEAGNSAELLEDITASLGRHSRLRHWEETLIMFAGMQRSTAERVGVLNAVLEGSSLLEGDQVLLAARLYVEMRKNENGGESELARSAVVRQIVDTLIWRSRPDIGRPYQMRRRALESLGSMRHVDAVPHMAELAFREVEVAGDGKGMQAKKRFDFSGMRMRAVAGLLELAGEIPEEVKAQRDDLRQMLEAWAPLLADGNVGPMIAILEENQPSVSAVAAFAFALVPNREASSSVLLRMLHDPETDEEVIWAINEVLGGMETAWLREKVILPWLDRKPQANGRLCYLIQRSAMAEKGTAERQYLLDALQGTECADRALRALAKVCAAGKEREWLRKACEAVVQGDWEGAQRQAGIPIPVGDDEATPWRLRHAALEALRDVGDAASVEVLRSVRTKLTSTLSQLSFQVGEEIYWRCKVGSDWESN
ncbi:MAG: CHAT domain-containing protein, partial [Bryobacterales bacterium]|nr:CHAT domain-containing protein [Bryobacterales bacterium]